jgi:hypothetical protein
MIIGLNRIEHHFYSDTVIQRTPKSGAEFRLINSELESHIDEAIKNAVENWESSQAVNVAQV